MTRHLALAAAVALAVASAFAFQSAPIIRGATVTFVADGDLSDPPRIVGDFNGWEPADMKPARDGRTYTLDVTLDPAARVEYLITYNGRFVVDPRNPLTVASPAGPLRSELRMPGYRAPSALSGARLSGLTIDTPIYREGPGSGRRVRLYVPRPAVSDPTRVLYVHDGNIFFEGLQLREVVDSLIEQGRIAPVAVVFIDSVDRHRDYAPLSAFRSRFATGIVPMAERVLRSVKMRGIERPANPRIEHRALMGLSRSTVGALDACVNERVTFESCVLLAPAIPEGAFDVLMPPGLHPARFIIEAGTYDIPLVSGARTLHAEMRRRGLSVKYTESPEGHNHAAFRARLPAVLEEMFPAAR